MTNSRFGFLRCACLLLVCAVVSGSAGCHESSGAQPSTVASVPSAHPAEPLAAPASGNGGGGPLSAVAGSANDVWRGSGGSAGLANANGANASAGAGAGAASLAGTNPEGEGGPVLVDSEGKALPQTDEHPAVGSASFQKRVALVARAIQSGDPEPALSAFFPLLAYQQVKDVAKPERDYKFRLLANFKRDVLEYHHALGADAASAKFDGITVSEKDAKWMAPGSEGNRVGYFRVLRSRLRFTLPTGRSRELELTSLISWRGEWYVVHLHGFK